MGAQIGAFFGLALVIISSIIAIFVGIWWGATLLNALAYLLLVYVILAMLSTRPKHHLLAVALGLRFRPVFNRYHLFIRTPGASTLYAGAMNALRLALVVFGGLAAWNAYWLLAATSAAYYAITSFLLPRLDPITHLEPAATRGNEFAQQELADLGRVRGLHDSIMKIPE
jgi:hypothetical protein